MKLDNLISFMLMSKTVCGDSLIGGKLFWLYAVWLIRCQGTRRIKTFTYWHLNHPVDALYMSDHAGCLSL